MEEVRYSVNALKQLRKYKNMGSRVLKAVAEYAADQKAHAAQVKPLVGSDSKRLRVGDFRVVFEESATAIVVTKIGPRGSVYD